jgi:hypothetical protein
MHWRAHQMNGCQFACWQAQLVGWGHLELPHVGITRACRVDGNNAAGAQALGSPANIAANWNSTLNRSWV